ncbi:Ppx/GppA family phosphatase [Kurthia sibirica]|uniref:Ppx/GppA family phosphatase n=1 Tax=Kurthia sibirica TaxID=202750 RepID=A0A2U3AQE2_9BACL|nr:Ppx/GppA family phosphatase [Kurthia sibirica]PWI26744.1 Ppx/GppA family phosphatase [Kurthia sibirica]GEK32726.1 exopolyphosphatase [Kurthia sibirica]
MTNNKLAIIDIGSNTIRLVIYQYSTISGLKEVGNIKAVARLRNYINDDGIMDIKGIEILENLLISFKEMIEDYHVDSLRAVATASIRQSKNGHEIIDRMLETTGIRIELLSEEEEAYFGYFAVVHTTSTQSAVTIDMGGGSTEITYFKNKELQQSISLPFGSVSLKHQFMKDNTMTHKERNHIYTFAIEQFAAIPWLENLDIPVVGIGGSARNMAKMDQSRKKYPLTGVHQYRMSKQDFIEINSELTSLSYSELKKLDGLSSDRADIIGPVAEVFRALMNRVGSPKFQFSRKGLREGLVMSSILLDYPDAFNKYDVFLTGAKYLASEFGKSEQQIVHHAKLAELLYEKLCSNGLWTFSEEEMSILKQGAKVFSIGEYLEQDAASQHTFYLLSNRSINGLNHKERVRLALLASYKNKEEFLSFLQPFESWFSKDEVQQLLKLGALLKIVYALDASKRGIVTNIEVDIDEEAEVLHMNVNCKGNPLAEEYQVNRQKKHFERVLKLDISVHFV